MQREVQNKRDVLLGDVNVQNGSDEERADNIVSRNMISVEITGERNENSAWMYGNITRYTSRLKMIGINSA